MRNNLSFLLVFLPILIYAQISSKIEKVTVFLNGGAQMTRMARVELKAGDNEIKFSNLSPFINPESIRVENANARLISVIHQQNFLEEKNIEQNIKLLQKEEKKIQDSLQQQQINLQMVQENLALLTTYKEAVRNAKELKLIELKELSEYYETRMKAMLQKQLKYQNAIQPIQEKLDNIRKQLNQLGHDSKKINHEVVIHLLNEKSQPTSCNIILNYFVEQASWVPIYNIKVDDLGKPLKMEFFALIRQKTQEDWQNVELTLSTAEPSISALLPELQPYYLDMPQLQVMSGKIEVEGMKVASLAKRTSSQEALSDDSPREEMNIQYQNIQNITSRNMTIKQKYSISSDDQERKVDVDEFLLTAWYKHFTIPKLNQSVYLTAETTDWSKHELLPAQANIYFNNNLIGQTYIDPTKIADTLLISLGVDKSISAERKQVKQFSNKKQFLNDKQFIEKQWEISIRNFKSNPVDIIVYDQIPVSQDKQIEVKKTLLGDAALDEQTGKLEWQIKSLAPQATKKINFSYMISFPKNINLDVQ